MFCDVLKFEFSKCYRFFKKLSNSSFRTRLILLGFFNLFIIIIIYISSSISKFVLMSEFLRKRGDGYLMKNGIREFTCKMFDASKKLCKIPPPLFCKLELENKNKKYIARSSTYRVFFEKEVRTRFRTWKKIVLYINDLACSSVLILFYFCSNLISLYGESLIKVLVI
jgi:hypothetical protein